MVSLYGDHVGEQGFQDDKAIVDYAVAQPNRAAWDKVSWYFNVAKVTTPTLFMVGDLLLGQDAADIFPVKYPSLPAK